ncbi:unnamed protein product, partial [Ectocarpus sp. 12 AP-2014]
AAAAAAPASVPAPDLAQDVPLLAELRVDDGEERGDVLADGGLDILDDVTLHGCLEGGGRQVEHGAEGVVLHVDLHRQDRHPQAGELQPRRAATAAAAVTFADSTATTVTATLRLLASSRREFLRVQLELDSEARQRRLEAALGPQVRELRLLHRPHDVLQLRAHARDPRDEERRRHHVRRVGGGDGPLAVAPLRATVHLSKPAAVLVHAVAVVDNSAPRRRILAGRVRGRRPRRFLPGGGHRRAGRLRLSGLADESVRAEILSEGLRGYNPRRRIPLPLLLRQRPRRRGRQQHRGRGRAPGHRL